MEPVRRTNPACPGELDIREGLIHSDPIKGNENVERRLAAILAADVAGYARMTGAVVVSPPGAGRPRRGAR